MTHHSLWPLVIRFVLDAGRPVEPEPGGHGAEQLWYFWYVRDSVSDDRSALPSARTVKTELSQAHSTYARAAVAILRFPLLE